MLSHFDNTAEGIFATRPSVPVEPGRLRLGDGLVWSPADEVVEPKR
jgi:hypothetical protein